MKGASRHLREFFEDARGHFNAFTLIALTAGITLATAPLVCRIMTWPTLNRDEISALSLVYCISALGDYLLGIFLNKMPSTLVQQNQGDGGMAIGEGATAGPVGELPPAS
ncbi:hypothetical protein FNT36_03280 [Hymenobacter setariae]|uniref:Uncharacterized protein n=1 Tax=Hymenobacter setariae TaxID=2594794 RepID=A0A558C2X7_9BACT|nr:hypothetical protein [Hymenobacter setariae]TVT43129.1 hypothetical protein FNT36_03280 [Hymenobacter setariae]